jgi:hypothetical protein
MPLNAPSFMPKRSLVTAVVLCALLAAVRFANPPRRALTWDVFGYYLYLPAAFIHQDVDLSEHQWLDAVMRKYEPSSTLYQVVDLPEGKRMIRYSSGMALTYAPFFFLAHLIAAPLGYPPDGFSAPYVYTVAYGVFALLLCGIFLLRRVLLLYFTDGITASLLVLIVLGTNLFHLLAYDGTLLTHGLLFVLMAALLWTTHQWHQRPSLYAALLVGAICGYMTLVRPSEGLCVLVPLLYRNTTYRDKLRQVWEHPSHVVFAAAAFAFLGGVQMCYWDHLVGRWFFYSYVNPGEGFDFATPHVREYLFSFRKGWFIYTPLAVLAFVGFVHLYRRRRALFWPVFAFVLADLYLSASWSNWWYAGGSFSARNMVPAYVLLAIPLGTLVQHLWVRARWRTTLGFALTALVTLNLFQTWQWTHGIISHERMTSAYYAAIFGRMRVPDGAERLLSVERGTESVESFADEARYRSTILALKDFDQEPDGVFTLTPDRPYAPVLELPYHALTQEDHAWIRVRAKLWVGDTTAQRTDGGWPLFVCSFHHGGQPYKYRTRQWQLRAGESQQWVTDSMDYLTPEVRSKTDTLKVYLWNHQGGTHRVDDLCVELWEERD